MREIWREKTIPCALDTSQAIAIALFLDKAVITRIIVGFQGQLLFFED